MAMPLFEPPATKTYSRESALLNGQILDNKRGSCPPPAYARDFATSRYEAIAQSNPMSSGSWKTRAKTFYEANVHNVQSTQDSTTGSNAPSYETSQNHDTISDHNPATYPNSSSNPTPAPQPSQSEPNSSEELPAYTRHALTTTQPRPHSGPYGFKSDTAYLSALREWAKEKQYLDPSRDKNGRDLTLHGFYGPKTTEDYVNRAKEKRRSRMGEASMNASRDERRGTAPGLLQTASASSRPTLASGEGVGDKGEGGDTPSDDEAAGQVKRKDEEDGSKRKGSFSEWFSLNRITKSKKPGKTDSGCT